MKKIILFIFSISTLLFITSCNSTKRKRIEDTPNYIYTLYGYIIQNPDIPIKYCEDNVTAMDVIKNQSTIKGGFIPDSVTALNIAKDIFIGLLEDEERAVQQTPYFVSLEQDSIWYIRSRLPEGYKGGYIRICLSKNTGQVLGYQFSK